MSISSGTRVEIKHTATKMNVQKRKDLLKCMNSNLSKCFSKNTLDKRVGGEGKVAGGTGDPAAGSGQLSINIRCTLCGGHGEGKRLASLHVSFCFAFIKKRAHGLSRVSGAVQGHIHSRSVVMFYPSCCCVLGGN